MQKINKEKLKIEKYEEKKVIYQTWIYLWCGTFKYQDVIEWEFRRN
jgi:hypothetical protein